MPHIISEPRKPLQRIPLRPNSLMLQEHYSRMMRAKIATSSETFFGNRRVERKIPAGRPIFTRSNTDSLPSSTHTHLAKAPLSASNLAKHTSNNNSTKLKHSSTVLDFDHYSDNSNAVQQRIDEKKEDNDDDDDDDFLLEIQSIKSSSDVVDNRFPQPGMLDLRNEKHRTFVDKSKKVIAKQKKVKVFIDFDDTMIFIKKVNQNPAVDTNVVINHYLIDYLARLLNEIGSEHVELDILSARLDDQYMHTHDDHIKISRFLPLFICALNAKLKKPIIEPFKNIHCLLGWKYYVIYGLSGKQTIELARVGPRFDLENLHLESAFIEETPQNIFKKFGIDVTPNSINGFSPCSKYYTRFFHESKASYLARKVITEEHRERYVTAHFDDNSNQLAQIERLGLDIELFKIIAQPPHPHPPQMPNPSNQPAPRSGNNASSLASRIVS